MIRPLFIGLCLLTAAVSVAAELAVGASRDEVVAQLGTPKSKLAAGDREILSYAEVRIILVDGKVTEIDRKRPVAPGTTTVTVPVRKNPAPPVPAKPAAPAVALQTSESWTTDFVAAQAAAAASGRRLLVLFTGSDWCPPCIQFEGNVAHAPAFLNAATPAFVLVKLDYPRSTPQPAGMRVRNEKLRQRYGVNSYPSLLVISADGAKSVRVETNRPRKAKDLADFYAQAVDEARRATE